MEFDIQQFNTQPLRTQVNSTAQQPVKDELDNEIEETTLSTASTLDVSNEGQTRASQTVSKTSDTPKIDNEDDAQLSAEKFQRAAANDSSLTEKAVSNNITSDTVKNLIG